MSVWCEMMTKCDKKSYKETFCVYSWGMAGTSNRRKIQSMSTLIVLVLFLNMLVL